MNVRRNTLLLAACMSVNSATLQLVAAISSLTFVLVAGIEGLLGLGPAIFLCAAALGALVAGRAMDRIGRVPVLATGFGVGSVGALVTALGTHVDSALAVVGGFALIGVAGGTAQLARAAAGDMYPPARRARGISYVLFGAVFGAILGPAFFSPLFRGRELSAGALTVPWLAAAGIMAIGLVIVLFVRPDPKRIAELLAPDRGREAPPEPAAPLGVILRRTNVLPALVAGVASFAVMVAVMNLAGYVVVEHRHHPQHLIFPIIGAHVLGMYALMPVVGTLVDRIGRPPALVGGLALMAVSNAGLHWTEGVAGTAVLLFGLGLGWNVSFVAATAQLADCAAPGERGKLLGFNDLLAGLTGASFVLIGGFALGTLGVTALALGSAAVALVAPAWMLARARNGRRPAVEPSP
ncbi:MAG: MFS transporter [Thermoleophilia bacterium]|nr:MFS transporter [Thermoleophilia bacterium]